MLETSEAFSPEKNNVILDLNRIREVVSSAGKFKTNYDDLINVIGALNSRCVQYSKLSKVAIQCDVIDGIIASVDFKDLTTKLNQKIREKSKPDVGLQWAPVNGSLSEINLEPYQIDEIENMKLFLPDSPKNRREVSRFSGFQKNALAYITSFLRDFDYFETSLQKRRDNIIKSFLVNIPFIANEHYKEVYKVMTSKGGEYAPPEHLTIGGVEVQFKNKQTEFIKNAIKTVCEECIH